MIGPFLPHPCSCRGIKVNYSGVWLIVMLLFNQVVYTSASVLNCPRLRDESGTVSSVCLTEWEGGCACVCAVFVWRAIGLCILHLDYLGRYLTIKASVARKSHLEIIVKASVCIRRCQDAKCFFFQCAGLVCRWNCQVLHWRTHTTCSVGHPLPVAMCGSHIHTFGVLRLLEKGRALKV